MVFLCWYNLADAYFNLFRMISVLPILSDNKENVSSRLKFDGSFEI